MINGILTIYKEKGWTSHDVVAKVRRIAGQKKAGHTGTLDPEAEGVLPVCLGPSTRVCSLLTDLDKTYEADMLLGVRTDTQDLTGSMLSYCDDIPGETAVREAILSFRGAYDQIPPMYSARKVNGRKLYELAREGVEAERSARRVLISEIEILEMNLPHCIFRVTCSKGTYIRTLCDDIGKKLGCGAAMASLLRTRVGVFTSDNAVRIADLQAAKETDGSIARYVLPPDRLFVQLPALHFTEEAAKAAKNGNFIPYSHLAEPGTPSDGLKVRMYDSHERFYGIYETVSAGAYCRPVRILTDLSQ